jgi:hypothetical protein
MRWEVVLGLAIAPLMVPAHAQERAPLVGILSPASQHGAEMSFVNQPFPIHSSPCCARCSLC